MGLSAHRTQNSIRISLGAGNTDEQVDLLLDKLPGIVSRLRSLTRVAR
jgi:cysteine sulfinate desulfinase/cysteine desulfurase-like protein